MARLKVFIYGSIDFECQHCKCINIQATELIYDDHLTYRKGFRKIISNLNLDQIINKELTYCRNVHPVISTAHRELIKNPDAYTDSIEAIEKIKIFLWGIRLTLEEYPYGFIKFVTE